LPAAMRALPAAAVVCGVGMCPAARRGVRIGMPVIATSSKGGLVGSVIKKRRKRMAKKKHRKLLRKTRVQRRNKK